MARIKQRLLSAFALALAAGALAATPAEAAPVDRHIWGVVVDGKGKPILGAEVVALRPKGDEAASMQSYASTDPNETRRGFFALWVGKGTYDVTVSKPGYVSERFDDVRVGPGSRVVAMGDISLSRVSTTGGKVTNEVRVGQQAVVKVTVNPTGAKPTGKVAVSLKDKQVGTATLKPFHNGVVNVTLDKLAKGTYELVAEYKGSGVFAASTSKKIVLEVKGKKRHQRPNARAWVA